MSQVVASVVIYCAAKLKFVAESRTGVDFAQHVVATCNTIFAGRQVGHKHGNMHNNVFNLLCKNVARQVEEKCCQCY